MWIASWSVFFVIFEEGNLFVWFLIRAIPKNERNDQSFFLLKDKKIRYNKFKVSKWKIKISK